MFSKEDAIDNLFEQLKIKLVLSNIARGISGYYLEKSKKNTQHPKMNPKEVNFCQGNIGASFW